MCKIGKSASETLTPLTVAYGEYAMNKSSVLEWPRKPKKTRMSHSQFKIMFACFSFTRG
jgi:hypothetical protein